MDFILSLTHFCEVHGPTSILCSQIIPTPCSQCELDSDAASSPSHDIPLSSHHEKSPSLELRSVEQDTKSDRQQTSCQPEAARPVASSVGSAAANANGDVESPLSSPASAPVPSTARRIEDLPYFLGGSYGPGNTESLNRLGGADDETCASCRLNIPENVSKQLPPGAPGTLKEDGKARNGSPVLRSRKMVHSCSGTHSEHDDTHESHVQQSPPPSSVQSSYSSDLACHPHIVTYLSLQGPPNPTDYALLRRASIRTLSCELLPRGLSSGPLSFGDSVTGYTIAYVFRLPDPMARGKRRSYALVALAGKDAGRAFRACPIIWRVFGRIASSLVGAAEKHQEREKSREEKSAAPTVINGRNYTPVSSFLTGRIVDPDGQPRRAGQIRARNLTEIVGNEYIFAELHAQFVALLQQLSTMFGGRGASDSRSTLSESYDDAGDGYFATRTSSSANGSTKTSRRNSSHHRKRSDIPSPVNLTPGGPEPIPISQRRVAV
ncbi:hypothetical protein VTO42DRAFT_952 [Malbranchea cinnamomea]